MEVVVAGLARIITGMKGGMVEVQTLMEGGLEKMVETTLEITQEGEQEEDGKSEGWKQ